MQKKSVKMEVINPNAAGIDIGGKSHFVAVAVITWNVIVKGITYVPLTEY